MKRSLFIQALAGIAGVVACGGSAIAAEPVRVALFADLECTDAKSREAAFKVLTNASPEIKVDKVSTQTIGNGSLARDYDVLILPGGTGSGEAKAVGVDGGRILTEFVRNGKGVIAICAGGYYVADGGSTYTGAVNLVNAVNHDGENWARGEQFIAVDVVGNKDGDTSRTMWYENGPIFVPSDSKELPPYVPLVRYVTDLAADGAPKEQMRGREAVLAGTFGKGRVVAFGPHPELSPGLNHWLVNSVTWAAGRRSEKPSSAVVLEGKEH